MWRISCDGVSCPPSPTVGVFSATTADVRLSSCRVESTLALGGRALWAVTLLAGLYWSACRLSSSTDRSASRTIRRRHAAAGGRDLHALDCSSALRWNDRGDTVGLYGTARPGRVADLQLGTSGFLCCTCRAQICHSECRHGIWPFVWRCSGRREASRPLSAVFDLILISGAGCSARHRSSGILKRAAISSGGHDQAPARRRMSSDFGCARTRDLRPRHPGLPPGHIDE